CARASSFDYW
nr:immunoglobulin heavy chain junction region [Mus musculus]MBK4186393.1 immunoglobulin heavy chain junction region [Mus musculus]MBK4186394.1 immunoglobulin heavy chain junction region [Mus musculus]